MSYATKAREPRFGAIGLRLTLWGSLITLTVCVLLCAILYGGIYYSLRHEVDSFLEGEVYEFTNLVEQYGEDCAGAESAVRAHLGSRSRRDLVFRLQAVDGRTLVSSDVDVPLPTANPARAPDAPRAAFETVESPDGRRSIRVCTVPIVRKNGVRCLAQAGYWLDRVHGSLSLFRYVCGFALAVAVILAGVGGWIVARRSLDPIRQMTSKAREIEASRLSERLPRTGNGDELDRLAETLNDLLERVQTYVARIQRFTADASHEFRTPLAALRGSAEVALSRERSAAELRQTIEDNVERFDRLQRIAEDLLLLSRFDAGEKVLELAPVRVDEAVADMVDLYAPLAEERSIQLRFDERVESSMDADGGRLRQLIGNLIDNAIKFTPPHGCVQIALARNDGHVDVTVTDTGPGIPPGDLPRVFDRFYRADSARTSQPRGGAGLGLSICRTIAEAHGGRIEIESMLERGTMIRVVLPLTNAGLK